VDDRALSRYDYIADVVRAAPPMSDAQRYLLVEVFDARTAA
jgi:hypothetical protein